MYICMYKPLEGRGFICVLSITIPMNVDIIYIYIYIYIHTHIYIYTYNIYGFAYKCMHADMLAVQGERCTSASKVGQERGQDHGASELQGRFICT